MERIEKYTEDNPGECFLTRVTVGNDMDEVATAFGVTRSLLYDQTLEEKLREEVYAKAMLTIWGADLVEIKGGAEEFKASEDDPEVERVIEKGLAKNQIEDMLSTK